MPENNKHITEYLEYYLDLSIAPEYAVLLRGDWGSGKTWFIKNFVAQHEQYKYLRVSLYGITSPREIEDAFYEQMHPVLSHKVTKLAAKVFKGLIKGALKIDLNGDGKEDATLNSTIPDIDLQEFSKISENRILIFDDLERCSIGITDLLGYINQYVENYGLKVILVANETEIIKRNKLQTEAKIQDYTQIKEKLIGKSFDVYSDLDAALKSFIGDTRSTEVQKILTDHIELLKELYRIGGYNNLRHLKQSIMDFDRFCDFLPNDLDKKEGLIDHILQLFFALSIETKKGDLPVNDISKIFLLDYLARRNGDEPTFVQLIQKKYRVFDRYYHPIDPVFFIAYFNNGTLDKAELEKNIRASGYFQDERTPAWAKLLLFENLEDDDFVKNRDAVWQELILGKIENKYILIHVIGVLKLLSDKGLFEKTWDEIAEHAKQNIERLRVTGKLLLVKHEQFPSNQFAGFAYIGATDPHFLDFMHHYKKVVAEAQAVDFPEKGKVLLSYLQSDLPRFLTQLTLSNSVENIYYDVPIFKYIDADLFVNQYAKLPNQQQSEVIPFLIKRYEFGQFIPNLKPERVWWEKVLALVDKLVIDKKGKVSGVVLERVSNAIHRILELLGPPVTEATPLTESAS